MPEQHFMTAISIAPRVQMSTQVQQVTLTPAPPRSHASAAPASAATVASCSQPPRHAAWRPSPASSTAKTARAAPMLDPASKSSTATDKAMNVVRTIWCGMTGKCLRTAQPMPCARVMAVAHPAPHALRVAPATHACAHKAQTPRPTQSRATTAAAPHRPTARIE